MKSESRPKAAPTTSIDSVLPEIDRSHAAERVALTGPLDGRLPKKSIELYTTDVLARLDSRGGIVVPRTNVAHELERLAEQFVDVAGLSLVLRYSTPLPAEIRTEINKAVWLAARGWAAIDRARGVR